MMKIKPHEVETRKESYLRHLHRLEEVKCSKLTPFKEIEAVDLMLKSSHRKHEVSLKFQRDSHKRNLSETGRSQGNLFRQVKSVVAGQINKPILTTVSRQKENPFEGQFIDQANVKLYHRLLKVKPIIQFSKEPFNTLENCNSLRNSRRTLPNIQNDYSIIYENSQLTHRPDPRIMFRLTRKKDAKKFLVTPLVHTFVEIIKDLQQSYTIQISQGKCSITSSCFSLQELLNAGWVVTAKPGPIKITIMRLFESKSIPRAIMEVELTAENGKTIEITPKITTSSIKTLGQVKLTVTHLNPIRKSGLEVIDEKEGWANITNESNTANGC